MRKVCISKRRARAKERPSSESASHLTGCKPSPALIQSVVMKSHCMATAKRPMGRSAPTQLYILMPQPSRC